MSAGPMDKQVIEWINPGPDDIVFRWTNENFALGSQLVVHEYEVAAFMRDGKLMDVFGPGRHVLTTQNLRGLTAFYNWVGGFKDSSGNRATPFKATLIFVAQKRFLSRWGLRLNVRADPSYATIIPMMANGGYQFRVTDAAVFLQQNVGGLQSFTSDSVNQIIRMFLVERLTQNFSKLFFTEVYGKLDTISTQAKVNVGEAFGQRGMELIDLKIEGVDSDNISEMNRVLGLMGPSRDAVMADRQLDIVKTFAQNPQGGGTVGGQMISVLPLAPMAATMQSTMQPAPSVPQVVVVCPNCGTHAAVDSIFCPKCGQTLKPSPRDRVATEAPPSPTAATGKRPTAGGGANAFTACPYCGKDLDLPKTPRFCPYCKESLVTGS